MGKRESLTLVQFLCWTNGQKKTFGVIEKRGGRVLIFIMMVPWYLGIILGVTAQQPQDYFDVTREECFDLVYTYAQAPICTKRRQ